MSQHDLDIANQGFPAFRSDLNSFLLAISSQQSGATAPPTTLAYQMYADTTNNVLKRRNSGNSAYIVSDTLNDSRVITSATATYTHVIGDMNRTILLDASSNNIDVTLLDAGTAGNGFHTTFIRIDNSVNTVNINRQGGDTINGQTSVPLSENGVLSVSSDGSSVWRVSSNLTTDVVSDITTINNTLDDLNTFHGMPITSVATSIPGPTVQLNTIAASQAIRVRVNQTVAASASNQVILDIQGDSNAQRYGLMADCYALEFATANTDMASWRLDGIANQVGATYTNLNVENKALIAQNHNMHAEISFNLTNVGVQQQRLRISYSGSDDIQNFLSDITIMRIS